MSNSAQSHPPRLLIVSPAPAATVQQPEAAVKTFAPVVERKGVELKFTISLQNATLSFDDTKRPQNKTGDWPCHAIASWAFWSQSEKNGEVTTSITPTKLFVCSEAAAVSRCSASNLQVQWREGTSTASSATITKKLKHKSGGPAFEEQFIQITVFAAASQGKAKDGSAKPPTSSCIELGTPFLVDLSVCWLHKIFFDV
jgi:hypothetical protein